MGVLFSSIRGRRCQLLIAGFADSIGRCATLARGFAAICPIVAHWTLARRLGPVVSQDLGAIALAVFMMPARGASKKRVAWVGVANSSARRAGLRRLEVS